MANRFPVFDQPITAITGPDIAEWRDVRLLSVSASSVNRELSLISTVFTHAMKEWRLGLTFNPCTLVAKPRKARPRKQRISIAEREEIIGKLGWDGISEPETSAQWVAFASYLALETAMRKGEILSLRWSDIDFIARHAHLDMTKNGDERFVPLSKAAMKLLKIVKHRTSSAPVVPVQAGNFDKLFRAARRDAGLLHIHFHDSRREAASTMAPKLSNVLNWQRSLATSRSRCCRSIIGPKRPTSPHGLMHNRGRYVLRTQRRHARDAGGKVAETAGPAPSTSEPARRIIDLRIIQTFTRSGLNT